MSPIYLFFKNFPDSKVLERVKTQNCVDILIAKTALLSASYLAPNDKCVFFATSIDFKNSAWQGKLSMT